MNNKTETPKKNNRVTVIIAIVLSVIALAVLTASIVTFVNKLPEKTDKGKYYVEADKAQSKTIEYNGKTYELAYRNTKNRIATVGGKVTAKWNAVDYYTAGNVRVGFYYNTDEICSFSETGLGYGEEIALNEDKACEIAREYLKAHIDADKYEVVLCYKSGTSYEIKMAKYINGIQTDDGFSTTVRKDGSVFGFSIFNTNRYDGLEFDEDDIESCRKSTERQAKLFFGSGDISVNEEYITCDSNGHFMLCRVYECKGEAEDFFSEID